MMGSVSIEIFEHLQKKKGNTISKSSISADQLIPVVMLIVVNSGLKHPLANVIFIEHFAYIDFQSNELGYCFINFHGVVEGLKSMPIPKEGEEKKHEDSSSDDEVGELNIEDYIIDKYFSKRKEKMLASKYSAYN